MAKKNIGFTRENHLEIARELYKQSQDMRFTFENRDMMKQRVAEIAKKHKFTNKDIYNW